jgi:hypothetical protein
MNDIIKNPHNIRSGQAWFDIMPERLQERWLFYTPTKHIDTLLTQRVTFKRFIYRSFELSKTEEGHDYWDGISEGYFGIKQKKSLWSKIINFFKL